MLETCNIAFKEWDISCRALCDGRQTLLIRKGGIKEDGGEFRIDYNEFLLMPTFDHQNAEMLQSEFLPQLEISRRERTSPDVARIQGFALVDSIWVARDEPQVNGLMHETIWNEAYVKLRFDYNPYDPLFLVMLRAYRLPAPVEIPMIKAYGGCKSWVTLETPVSVVGAIPALSEDEFQSRKTALLDRIS